MKSWFSNWWLPLAIFLVVGGLIVGTVVPSTLERAREERACNECIQTNCVEVKDGCACAECIMICR